MLSLITFLPAFGALLIGLIPRERKTGIRSMAIAISLLTLALSFGLFMTFDSVHLGMQFEEQAQWIPQIGITYHVGVDGISLFLIMLTTFLVPLLLFAPWDAIRDRIKLFSMMLLILETAVIGVFISLDLVLFYIFWEAMLIPMYFIIGIWGGERGSYAAIKFFLYTMSTSVLMLVAIIVLYFVGGNTFDLMQLKKVGLDSTLQLWLFGAFAAAFAVKVPLWPFHSWLPDAYSEAPTSGTILLSAIMSKAGLYGLIRFGLTLFPSALLQFGPYLLALALIGVIYGALVAWAQKDLKRLVAYSSISHLGLVAMGIFAFTLATVTHASGIGASSTTVNNPSVLSLTGSVMQMINHGIIIAALFLILAILWDRFGKRGLNDFGGLAEKMPRFMTLFLFVMLASVALPGTNGFVGEFLILLGTFMSKYQVYAIIAATIAVLSAVYMLWMTQRSFHGPVSDAVERSGVKDLSGREAWLLIPLVILILWMGIFPNLWLSRIRPSVEDLLSQAQAHVQLTTHQAEKNP
ncbi:NADH-quinone oxidoreductase subunit M [Candidatus Acetothermia bacterium]|nr:NADH-quinone oxidoreductase subunit M [Candidatus Acetothermia bacterium]